jgi:DNA-binding response OmpR family regulator
VEPRNSFGVKTKSDLGMRGAPMSVVNILLVEDHHDTRTVLSTLLQHSGHSVIVAGSYAEALRLLVRVRLPADVLLCDLGLPDGDGLDLVGKAKVLRRRMTTIAVTARGSDRDKELGRQAGFDHYITKPLDYQQLRTLLAQAVPPSAL